MANWFEMTDEQRQAFREWYDSRPAEVQAMIDRYPPEKLYRLKTTGKRATIESYAENGTVSVNVTGQFNRVLFSQCVFGVEIGELEECELPLPGEDLGDTAAEAGYSEEDIKNILIPKIRDDLKKRNHLLCDGEKN